MKWQVKAVVDTAKVVVPFYQRLRHIKRRYQPYQTEPDRDAWTISEGLQQIQWLRDVGFRFEDATILEIGTGWQPLIPILYYLAGCRKVYLTDTQVLMDAGLIHNALRIIGNSGSQIKPALGLTDADFHSKCSLPSTGDLAALLASMNMEYLAPCDTSRLSLDDHSLDLVFSRAVLEHVPPPMVRQILGEAGRLLKPGALTLHFVDNSDHWEFDDKSISRVNFLKYPEFIFRITYLNPLNYQNRLRHCEYVELLKEAGFAILREQRDLDSRSVAVLKTMRVAKRFHGMPAEELATIGSGFLACNGSLK